MAAPGAQQALDRTGRIEVEVAGRVGDVPRPNLLGALVAKAATTAIAVDPGSGRHVSDFAILASLSASRLETLAQSVAGDHGQSVRAAGSPHP